MAGFGDVRSERGDRAIVASRSGAVAKTTLGETLRGVPDLDQHMSGQHAETSRRSRGVLGATLRGAPQQRSPRPAPSDEDSAVRPRPPEMDSPRPDDAVHVRRSAQRARVFSLAMLAVVFLGLGFAGHTAYHAMRDCYVAPSILSPSSDIVLASKLKVNDLTVERERASAELQGIEAGIAADEQSIGRLREIRAKQQRAADLTAAISSARASAGAAELRAIKRQRNVIASMLNQQRKLTQQAWADVEAGVISRTDYAKESQTLNQIELALLDNERAKFRGQPTPAEAAMATSGSAEASEGPPSPELLAHDVEAIRVELEIMRIESDRRAKVVQRAAEVDRVAKLNESLAQLKSRPVYQAIDKSVDVAFVPYTQIDGISAGAGVFACTWGLFFCKQVGTVADGVPGEVVSADPWGGTSTRGEYIVLELWDRESAKLKTLRVRRAAARRTSETPEAAPGG